MHSRVIGTSWLTCLRGISPSLEVLLVALGSGSRRSTKSAKKEKLDENESAEIRHYK